MKNLKQFKYKINNISKYVVTVLLLVSLAMLASFGRSANLKINNQMKVNALSTDNKLSLVEINDSFGTLLMRSSQHKTIVYVERLYFDYSVLSSLRLRELDCAINITNANGEWAKVGGWVKSEQMIRPNDLSGNMSTVYYLEVQQYWEWRNFTNNESWVVNVTDGYNSLEFDFNRGKDGTIYHIDGVYGLPNTEYRQVAYWCDLNNSNLDLVQSVTEYTDYVLDEVEKSPHKEIINLKPLKFKGEFNNYRVMSNNEVTQKSLSTSNGVNNSFSAETEPKNIIGGIILGVFAITFLVVSVVATVQMFSENENAPEIVPPGLEENGVTEEIKEEYEQNKPELTEEQRAELDKHKEFSLDNDAPSTQKIVKLKVLDEDMNQMSCYDENGDELWVNRKTYTVGNATFALIDRKAWLLIKFDPTTMQLANTAGDKITVNADNKIMNMDGVQCLSPKTVDDVLKKLSDMGTYTSSIDYKKLLFRMDDDSALKVAMGESTRDVSLGFWGTIKQALNNIFGGNNSTSQGFLSGFLDVVILIAVIIILALAVAFIVKFLFGLLKNTK